MGNADLAACGGWLPHSFSHWPLWCLRWRAGWGSSLGDCVPHQRSKSIFKRAAGPCASAQKGVSAWS